MKVSKLTVVFIIAFAICAGAISATLLEKKAEIPLVVNDNTTYLVTASTPSPEYKLTAPTSPVAQEYGSLSYNSVDSNYTDLGIAIHFVCPNCGYQWTAYFKPVDTLPANYDFNHVVVFQCPNCRSNFSIYMALHNDSNGLKVCLQRTDAEGARGISVDWWKR
jgi:predicted RNA-binding Zn-ribbon protein involved in translation (DUF1610 family)